MTTRKPKAQPAPKTIKLAADGTHLAADATQFAGILNIRDQIVTAYASSKHLTQRNAEKAAAKLAQIPGYTPWELMSDKDAELIVDRRFFKPAVDPEEYPHITPDWHWTRTPDASSPSGGAWSVNFVTGSVYWDCRGYCYRALAVCRPVPASQQ
jgi:hypothetical protein